MGPVRSIATLVITLLAVVAAASAAQAEPSRGHGFVRDARGFAAVDVPGASITAVLGSNRSGEIVGAYLDNRRRYHGFLRERRRLRRIDFPRAEASFAAAINDRGRVVGAYTDDVDTPGRQFEHGFLRDARGRFRRIDVRGATQTRPPASPETRKGSSSPHTPGPSISSIGWI